MRLYNQLIFDDDINAGTAAPVYTSPIHMDQLASASALRVFAVGSNASGTSPVLSVVLEETADPSDERFWVTKGTAINAVTLSATLTTIAKGSDTGSNPASAFLRAKLFLGGTNPRASIRLWVTGRAADPSAGLGLRPGSYMAYHEKVFDDFIEGTNNIYSRAEFNELLGVADSYCLFAIVQKASGSSNLTVQLEESPDGVQWRSKAGTAEINASALTAGAANVVRGFDNGSVPSSGVVRARIALGGGTPEGRVQLWITGRGEKRLRR